jgi:hypothetical protein
MQKVCEQVRFSPFLEEKNGKIRLSKKAIRWLYRRFYKQ